MTRGPSPFFGIELFGMAPDLTGRVRALLGDLDRGKVTVEEVIRVVLDIVNRFIGSFEDDPQVSEVLKGLSGKQLSVRVEGLTGVTGTLSAGQEVRIEKGTAAGIPGLVFKDIATLEQLLTGELDDVEALRAGKIEVVHLADFLKMVAPVVALQSKRKKEFQERLQSAMDRVLRERGY